jgi:hypothetical protein
MGEAPRWVGNKLEQQLSISFGWVYGNGFVRLSVIPFSLALIQIAFGERPSLSPMILRGRFSFANFLSCEMSSLVQGLPTFLVDIVVIGSSPAGDLNKKHLLTGNITVDMHASNPSTAFGILN